MSIASYLQVEAIHAGKGWGEVRGVGEPTRRHSLVVRSQEGGLASELAVEVVQALQQAEVTALRVSGPGECGGQGRAGGVGGLGKVDEAAGRGGAGDKGGPDFLHRQLPYTGSVCYIAYK